MSVVLLSSVVLHDLSCSFGHRSCYNSRIFCALCTKTGETRNYGHTKPKKSSFWVLTVSIFCVLGGV
uniref:Uncharacterized protein n=1 Tax=Arundo donax TaxID=35708 RepID=A0A0A9FRH3_ARUDO